MNAEIQSKGEKELKSLIDAAKSAMKNKEVTIITITTHQIDLQNPNLLLLNRHLKKNI